MKNKKL